MKHILIEQALSEYIGIGLIVVKDDIKVNMENK